MPPPSQPANVTGVPDATHKSRRLQVAVSIWAGWVALYLPHAYNLAIYPFAAALLALSSSLQRSYAKTHAVDLRYSVADVSLPARAARNPPQPASSLSSLAAASPQQPADSSPAACPGGMLSDAYTHLLGALANATRGLPHKQPLRHQYQASTVSRPSTPSSDATFAVSSPPEEQSIHAARNFVQPYLDAGTTPPMPECWGHRGASGVFPENTMASFERAVEDGSEGIETGAFLPG